jgi:hypothetical protein
MEFHLEAPDSWPISHTSISTYLYHTEVDDNGADRKHKSQITFAHLHIFLCFGGKKCVNLHKFV